jgi:aspartyl-tRNA(Asn)/glutamyl-tRNA(Gln) amidotransferase subunit C
MRLSVQDVQRIATLARIAVSERDIDQVAAQLQGIFGLIEQMQAVDTRAVEPMSHAQELVLRLRPDEIGETDRREQFQAVAPAVEAGLYLVPKVIE